jgi:WD40 repeat protein
VTAVSVSFVIYYSRTADSLKVALKDAELSETQLARDKGLALCEQGEVGTGLLWLARSLESAAKADAPADIHWYIRMNLTGWSQKLFGCEIHLPQKDIGTGIDTLLFSPSGKTFLTRNGTSRSEHICEIKLWDSMTGKVEFVLPPGNYLGRSTDRNQELFSPNGKVFATPIDGPRGIDTIRVWDATSGKPVGSPIKHPGWEHLFACSFNAQGTRLLIESDAAGGSFFSIWETNTGRLIGELRGPEKSNKRGEAFFSTDGGTVVTQIGYGKVQFWDAISGKFRFMLPGFQLLSDPPAFDREGKTMLTRSEGGAFILWDSVTGKPIGEPFQGALLTESKEPMGGSIERAFFSPDGQIIGTTFEEIAIERQACLWDRERRKLIAQFNDAEVLAFSPDSRKVVINTRRDGAKLLEAATGKLIGQPMPESQGVAFNRDSRIAIVDQGYILRLWDATTGKPIGPPLSHGEGPVWWNGYFPLFNHPTPRILTVTQDRGTSKEQAPESRISHWSLVPVEGDAKHIVLWAQVLARGELDSEGKVRKLDEVTWEQRRQFLESRTSSSDPDNLIARVAKDRLYWQRQEAKENQQGKR